MRTEEIATEVFFFPAASHTEKSGTFTNTNRMLQWHEEAVPPRGDCRSDLWFYYHLGRLLRARSVDNDRDRPLRTLTWDYPVSGPYDEPSASAVLAEINGYNADGEHLSSYEELKDDGSTRAGCWIYTGVFKDGVNQAARRKPWTEQNRTGAEWGWAWPGGMTRWLPYLAELQPEFFCEVSPELASERGLEHLGWATIVSARNVIEARVLVTSRMTPLRVQGRTVHQIGMPYHWGPNGLSRGDSANELSAMALDANTHIQEVKAWTADIRPGRRPRGRARPEYVARYRDKGGVSEHTGQEV